MAYTTTTDSSGHITLTGTSGADQATSAGTNSKKFKANTFDGLDTLTVDATVSSGSIGMGGAVDALTISAAATKLDITLGAGADTFAASAVATKLTVGGGGGADTFTFTAAATTSIFKGGQGADKFVNTTADMGDKITIVGGSENDVVGTSSARFQTGTNAFINGQVGADSIFLDGTAGMTVHGGSEADTINNSTDVNSCLLSGDKGADTIVDGAGDNTIKGGGGADTITAGLGVDSITGGLGKDDFVVNDIVVGAAALQVNDILDFTAADDQVGNFSVSDLETLTILTNLEAAGQATSDIAAGTTASITKVTGAYDLGTAGTGNMLALGSSTAFTTTTLVTALETGGSLALTANGAFAAADGFIVFYDDNIDSYAALVTVASGGSFADNTTSTDLAVTNLVKFDNFSDATAITSSQMLAFTA